MSCKTIKILYSIFLLFLVFLHQDSPAGGEYSKTPSLKLNKFQTASLQSLEKNKYKATIPLFEADLPLIEEKIFYLERRFQGENLITATFLTERLSQAPPFNLC